MANLKTQIFSRNANSVTYALPSNPNQTVRFKNAQSNKVIKGISLTNYKSEIIVHAPHTVVIGDTAITDLLSVRISTSGAHQSDAAKKSLLKTIATQLSAWADEEVLCGFEPTTIPELPEIL